MQKDAEMHAEEDKKKQEAVEAKNMAESMIYTAEKALRENSDKVPADIKADVEAQIAEVKKVKDGTDVDAITKATETLSTHMQKIGEAMAKAQSEAPKEGGEAAQAESPKEEGGTTPGGTVHDV
jgi:molecular chaperone DnaK